MPDLAVLARSLPTGKVVTDRDILETYARDRSEFTPSGTPRGAVLAHSADDIQATLTYASQERIPVVVRGAGSGLSGGANAVDGGLVLVTSGMEAIEDLDTAAMTARVQPGVINGELKRAAAQHGLFYPPDPASAEFSSLGGNISTNAGGLCCLKYGVTRDYVLSLDVVLAEGSRIRTGSSSRKSSAGYDLTSLMVGAEGTLGVVVGALLRLIPAAASPATLVATFSELDRAALLPTEFASAGVTPSLLELMDQATVNAVEDMAPMGLDRELAALVIAQSDSPNAADDIARMARIAEQAGANETFHSAEPAEAAMLLEARKLAFPALERRQLATVLDDVAVPQRHVAHLVETIGRIRERYDVSIATFGHLGDGNLHPTIQFERDDPDARTRAVAAFDAIVATALEMDGTVTGEHGVGYLKAWHLGHELDPMSQVLHGRIKEAFDPHGVLNPGKIVPATRG